MSFKQEFECLCHLALHNCVCQHWLAALCIYFTKYTSGSRSSAWRRKVELWTAGSGEVSVSDDIKHWDLMEQCYAVGWPVCPKPVPPVVLLHCTLQVYLLAAFPKHVLRLLWGWQPFQFSCFHVPPCSTCGGSFWFFQTVFHRCLVDMVLADDWLCNETMPGAASSELSWLSALFWMLQSVARGVWGTQPCFFPSTLDLSFTTQLEWDLIKISPVIKEMRNILCVFGKWMKAFSPAIKC